MSKPLALVIEDDYDAAVIMQEALQAADFQVQVAHDGQTALRHLAETVPRLVALDLHLPHVAGNTILKQIRADERFKQTRVMLITADDRLAQIAEQDADLVLLKPVTFTQLQQLAARLRNS